jgi:hypothetical protein
MSCPESIAGKISSIVRGFSTDRAANIHAGRTAASRLIRADIARVLGGGRVAQFNSDRSRAATGSELATLSDAVAVRRASATTADIGPVNRPAAYSTTRMLRPRPPTWHASAAAGEDQWGRPDAATATTHTRRERYRACTPVFATVRTHCSLSCRFGSPLRSSTGTQRSDGISPIHSRSPIVPTWGLCRPCCGIRCAAGD